MRRSYVRISSYVSREFLLSFAVAFLFFFVVFFVNQILVLAEEILTKKVPPRYVALLILYSMPSIIALSFPFGTLLGALMALGRISSQNEVVAAQASGIPLRRIFYPFVVISLGLFGISFVMNDYFLPVGAINFSRLYRELVYSNPELELEPYSVKEFDDNILIPGAVSESTIEDLIIIKRDGDRKTVFSAGTAVLGGDSDSGVISLEMNSVFSQTPGENAQEEYEFFRAASMTYNILLRDITFSVRTLGAREMSSYDVYQRIVDRAATLDQRRHEQTVAIGRRRLALAAEYDRTIRAVIAGRTDIASARPTLDTPARDLAREVSRTINDRTLQIYRIEFHKKIAIPFACITFVLFAFPVGITSSKSSRMLGFGVGLLVCVVFWALLIGGDSLGTQNLDFPPALAMWFPNIVVFAAAALVAFFRFRR